MNIPHREQSRWHGLPMTSSRSLPVRVSPRPVRSLARRFASSAFARDVRANGGFLALGCALVLVLAVLLGLMAGHYVSWSGIHAVPTDSVYTGTDAGLLPPSAGR